MYCRCFKYDTIPGYIYIMPIWWWQSLWIPTQINFHPLRSTPSSQINLTFSDQPHPLRSTTPSLKFNPHPLISTPPIYLNPHPLTSTPSFQTNPFKSTQPSHINPTFINQPPSLRSTPTFSNKPHSLRSILTLSDQPNLSSQPLPSQINPTLQINTNPLKSTPPSQINPHPLRPTPPSQINHILLNQPHPLRSPPPPILLDQPPHFHLDLSLLLMRYQKYWLFYWLKQLKSTRQTWFLFCIWYKANKVYWLLVRIV